MTNLTALIIQTNDPKDIICDAGGPSKNGKWTGWISLYRDGEFHTDLCNTEAIYKTKKEAIKKMKELVKEIRKINLEKK